MKRALFVVLALVLGTASAQETVNKGIRSDTPRFPVYEAYLKKGILLYCAEMYYLNARDRDIALRIYRRTEPGIPVIYLFEMKYIVRDGKNIVLDLLSIQRRDHTGLKTLYTKPSSDPIERFIALPTEKQIELIHQWEKAKGIENTEKLARIIPCVNTVTVLPTARTALAKRLTRMTDRTLEGYFADPDAHIREAAGVAMSLKALARRSEVRELIAK